MIFQDTYITENIQNTIQLAVETQNLGPLLVLA